MVKHTSLEVRLASALRDCLGAMSVGTVTDACDELVWDTATRKGNSMLEVYEKGEHKNKGPDVVKHIHIVRQKRER